MNCRDGKPAARIGRLVFCLLATAALASAQDFENPPILLKAADTVPAEMLAGKDFQLAETVENDGYMNHYVVETRFGNFEAEGNMQLRTRLIEVEALAKLEEVTRTEAFTQALEDSLTATAETAVTVVQHPVKTAKSLPGGVRRFVKRTARQVEDVSDDVSEYRQERKQKKQQKAEQAQSSESDEGDGSGVTAEEAKELAKQGGEAAGDYAKKWLGYTGARRSWAKQLGVDPYSDNEVLNRELLRVAQAASAGGLTLRFTPVPRLDALDTLADVSELVYEMDPLDLRMRDEGLLYGMGVSEAGAEDLFENPYLTPTTVTLVVDALTRLEGVGGRVRAVEDVAEAQSKAEVGLLLRSLNFLAVYHNQIRALTALGDPLHFPHATAEDGRLVVVAAVDHLHWTPELAQLAKTRTPEVLNSSGAQVVEAWIEGGCSPLAKSELEALGYRVNANAFQGVNVSLDGEQASKP